MKRLLGVLVSFLVTVTLQAQQLKQLQFREEIYDFGKVEEEGGPAVHQFDFTNAGTRPIRILSVKASCGCTTPDWSKEPVAPGRAGFIQASFNPKGRPGYFNKSLTVMTDFDSNPIVLQIKGHVENDQSPDHEISDYPSAKGNLRLKVSSFNMGKVYLKDEFVRKEFPVMNAGTKPITVQRVTEPAYIQADMSPKTLKPGEAGKIFVNYNGRLKNQYGFQSDNVMLYTDDEDQPVKSFSVYATLEEFFPRLTQKELEEAPQIKIVDLSFDMGNVKQNTVGKYQVSFLNVGKSNLEVRAIQPNCTCITAKASKETLKPGDNATIDVSFNPQERLGTQQKAIMVYTNDPQNPVQRIIFTAYVED